MLLRDRLQARLAAMGTAPDYQRLATEVLGIRNAPIELARRLVSQALVVEDRRETWLRVGERLSAQAPATPGVYIFRDQSGRALYVGKANNIRRRMQAHFARSRWRGLKPEFVRIASAEWIEVGSEIEALLREAALIAELAPAINVQIGPPKLETRAVPEHTRRDVIVIAPSVDEQSAELIAASVDGRWLIQRTARNGAGLIAHTTRVWRFFHSPLGDRESSALLAPLVFSWLARRGAQATRLDPHADSARVLRRQLTAALKDESLFAERIVVR